MGGAVQGTPPVRYCRNSGVSKRCFRGSGNKGMACLIGTERAKPGVCGRPESRG